MIMIIIDLVDCLELMELVEDCIEILFYNWYVLDD